MVLECLTFYVLTMLCGFKYILTKYRIFYLDICWCVQFGFLYLYRRIFWCSIKRTVKEEPVKLIAANRWYVCFQIVVLHPEQGRPEVCVFLVQQAYDRQTLQVNT